MAEPRSHAKSRAVRAGQSQHPAPGLYQNPAAGRAADTYKDQPQTAAQSSRREARAEAEAARLTQALATGLADQVSRTVDSIRIVLTEIIAHTQRGEALGFSPETANLVRNMSQLRALLSLDERGQVVQSMPRELATRNFAGSEWFHELLHVRATGASGVLRLLAPQPGRALEETSLRPPWRHWVIPLAISLLATEGLRGAFVVALLNPDHLSSIAAAPAEAFGVSIRIYDFTGRLLARDDRQGEGIGEALPENWLFRDFLP